MDIFINLQPTTLQTQALLNNIGSLNKKKKKGIKGITYTSFKVLFLTPNSIWAFLDIVYMPLSIYLEKGTIGLIHTALLKENVLYF